MSGHSDWIMKAARAVESEFPSMSYIDVHRVVEIAVNTYEEARRAEENHEELQG
jgi:hypothetical protein